MPEEQKYKNAFKKNIQNFFENFEPEQPFYQPKQGLDWIRIIIWGLTYSAVIAVMYFIFN